MKINTEKDINENQYLDEEGTFTFEITKTEAKKSMKGNDMHVYDVKDIESGKVGRVQIPLMDKVKWKYAKFAKSLGLSGELDTDKIFQNAVGRKFKGVVKKDSYQKTNLETGQEETKISYKIEDFVV